MDELVSSARKHSSQRNTPGYTFMVQGTASNVGKSVLTAALCRSFMRRGMRVAPFKSQNMALNSFVDDQGREMGRAQVTQAYAAGLQPCADMNPILLKPSTDCKSQLIVHGRVRGTYSASEYHALKTQLMDEVIESYERLQAQADWVIIEGAGSPAEINLREGDLVNMGLAEKLDIPVILVADIDKGGIFASLVGTLELISVTERKRVIGCVINKFRGDLALLQPGIEMFEEKTGVKVLGVLPYIHLGLDDEDSLSQRLQSKSTPKVQAQEPIAPDSPEEFLSSTKVLRVAVLALPKLSNFSDFTALEYYHNLELRYCHTLSELEAFNPNLIIIPGSKSSVAELDFLRAQGIDLYLHRALQQGCALLGICGGMQLLGSKIYDPHKVESDHHEVDGLGIMEFSTHFQEEKIARQRRVHSSYLGSHVLEGYEIHHGVSALDPNSSCSELYTNAKGLGYISHDSRCLCSYLHGFFDQGSLFEAWVKEIFDCELIPSDDKNMQERFHHEIERLADITEEHLDLDHLIDEVRSFIDARLSTSAYKASSSAATPQVLSELEHTSNPANLNPSYGSVMLASLASGSGKTSLSLGLCRALTQRGIKLKAYKAGPDYIDTAYLSLASNSPAGNLDLFLSDPEKLYVQFTQDAQDCELQFVESAMGLYDGLGSSFDISAADTAVQFNIPLVLCIPALAYSGTAAALAYGLANLDPRLHCIGFIVTQAKSSRHAQLIADSVSQHVGLNYFGSFAYREELYIKSRHLGLSLLQHSKEQEEFEKKLDLFAKACEEDLDLDGMLGALQEFQSKQTSLSSTPKVQTQRPLQQVQLRLAYAYDEVFSFYYESSLSYLRQHFELIPFSPLKDTKLPNCDALYIGGGYPELYAQKLSANTSLREQIKEQAERGLPIYAECGGYMYLARTLVDTQGASYPMVGIFPSTAIMQHKRSTRFGYVYLRSQFDTAFTTKDQQLKAHEFHYSVMDCEGKVFEFTKAATGETWKAGQAYKSCLASYAHLDLSAHENLVDNMIQRARWYHDNSNTHDTFQA